MSTLVLQSHRMPLPRSWLRDCLDSVQSWAAARGYDYRFVDDRLWDVLEPDLLSACEARPVVGTDIARLRLLQGALGRGIDGLIPGGYQQALWFDADFLVIDPPRLRPPADAYAVGREIWVQRQNGRLRSFRQVHNAALSFCAGNPFLDFYEDTAVRLVRRHQGPMVPQFVGPKLLTALHNVAGLPVWEAAGALSPAVIDELVETQTAMASGPALALFRRRIDTAPAGVNLAASLLDGHADADIEALLVRLCRTPELLAPA